MLRKDDENGKIDEKLCVEKRISHINTLWLVYRALAEDLADKVTIDKKVNKDCAEENK